WALPNVRGWPGHAPRYSLTQEHPMNHIHARRAALVLTPVTLACALAACGGDSNSTPTPPATTTFAGKVVATSFKADASGNPVITSGYYQGATVFVDANGNGVKDA